MIRLSGVDFGYVRPNDLFRGFSWSADRGDVWAVLGPSGCGKTTLLYLLAGLRRPSRGTVEIAGSPVNGSRRQTSLILQDHGLLPWATVIENAALGLRLRGVSRRARETAADEWLARLGLAAVRDRYPWQLSGGQRQRVAIARALVLSPDLLLMDEPFASLDALTREDLQESLVELTAAGGPTVVLVTHDVAEAAFVARRVLVLPRHPITSATVIENPTAGADDFRLRSEFFEVCTRIRAEIGRARAPLAAETDSPAPSLLPEAGS